MMIQILAAGSILLFPKVMQPLYSGPSFHQIKEGHHLFLPRSPRMQRLRLIGVIANENIHIFKVPTVEVLILFQTMCSVHGNIRQ